MVYNNSEMNNFYLRGRVKFPTGGDKASAFKSVTREHSVYGGSGEKPEPTVQSGWEKVKRASFADSRIMFICNGNTILHKSF
jgi:hypothetical protein